MKLLDILGEKWEKFRTYNKKRIEGNFERIISQYPLKEQELIRKGKNIELTNKSLSDLIKENPNEKFIPLTDPLSYAQQTLLFIEYKTTVKYWLELGKLNADILCNCMVVPVSLSDAGGMTKIYIGIPIKKVKQ